MEAHAQIIEPTTRRPRPFSAAAHGRRGKETVVAGLLALGCVFTPELPAASVQVVNPSGEINNGVSGTAISDPSLPGWDATAGEVLKGGTDYGNGGWRLSFEDSEEIHQMTTHPVSTGASYSLRFDAAITGGTPPSGDFTPDLTLVSGALLNGDFNADTSAIDSRTFAETPSWYNLAGNQAQQATRNTPASLLLDGTRNAVVDEAGARLFALDTGHTLATGEVFRVTYQWIDGFNWNDGSDRVGVTLFTTSDDTTNGIPAYIQTLFSETSTADAAYQAEVGTFSPIAGAAGGKRLFLLFEGVDGSGDTSGFCRVDNLTLQRGTLGTPPPPRVLIAELYVDDSGSRLPIASRSFPFKSATVGTWNHYHLAATPGALDSHAGKTLGVRFRSNDSGPDNVQSVDNVRLDYWPASSPDGSFTNDWNTTPNQVWIGPGYWANRLHDWQVNGGRVNCIDGARDRRTLHRVGTSIRGNGAGFSLSVRTGLNAGSNTSNARAGFVLGAGPNLDWRGALLVHGGLGRDFGTFFGLRSDGAPVVEDLSAGSLTLIDAGPAPVGGFPLEARLDLDAVYSAATGEYTVTLSSYDAANALLGSASVVLPSDRVLGSFGLLSHRGDNNARFWFDDFAGTGGALNPEPDRHLAVLGAMHTLSRGTLKLTAQLPPLSLSPIPSVALETHDGASWNLLATAPVDNTEGLSSYTATFKIPGWDDTTHTSYRVRVDVGGVPYYWSGTIREDPVSKNEIVVAATTCQRLADNNVQNNGNDWTPVDTWQPHTLAFTHIGKHQPDLLLALGDQIYEGQPTPADNSSAFNRHHDYLYKWYLWVLQARDLTRDIPTIAIPDDHDIYQGNLWGEGGIATSDQNTGGYERPASWVRMVERTQTSNLPDPDPYNPVQPPPTVAQGIGVYFTGLVYGRIGVAILEDRKFKTGRTDPPVDPAEQHLLGDRQHEFLRAFATDWGGQDIKFVASQSPLGNLHTHGSSGYNFGLNDRDTHGWPLHRRNEAWSFLRLSRMFQVAGDQHLATVVHHGIADPADAGFSFTVPAIANFFPRVWDPAHNAGGTTPTVSPNLGDFFFDGVGTLPDGVTPNLTAADPAHVRLLAVANPLQYYQQTRDISPANLHDRGAGYGIVRLDKTARRIIFECWPLHVDPEAPQTGSQFPDWPVTLSQTDNDGRIPSGFLPLIDTHSRKNPVIRVYDENTAELVYAMRIRGNLFRPPVYTNGTTYRVEISHDDDPVSEVLSNQLAQAAGPHSIHRFVALNPSIVSGGRSTLQWDVEGAATFSIDNGVGDVTAETVHGVGYRSVSPATNTTYTLTSTPPVGPPIQATTTVRVFPDKDGWRALYFSPAELTNPALEATLWGDAANPDLDLLTNGDEFLFQGDPRTFSPNLLPRGTVVNSNNNQLVLFSYHSPVHPEDCAFVLERSQTLADWEPLPANSVWETGRDDFPPEGSTRITVQLASPLPEEAPRRYYRGMIVAPAGGWGDP